MTCRVLTRIEEFCNPPLATPFIRCSLETRVAFSQLPVVVEKLAPLFSLIFEGCLTLALCFRIHSASSRVKLQGGKSHSRDTYKCLIEKRCMRVAWAVLFRIMNFLSMFTSVTREEGFSHKSRITSPLIYFMIIVIEIFHSHTIHAWERPIFVEYLSWDVITPGASSCTWQIVNFLRFEDPYSPFPLVQVLERRLVKTGQASCSEWQWQSLPLQFSSNNDEISTWNLIFPIYSTHGTAIIVNGVDVELQLAFFPCLVSCSRCRSILLVYWKFYPLCLLLFLLFLMLFRCLTISCVAQFSFPFLSRRYTSAL